MFSIHFPLGYYRFTVQVGKVVVGHKNSEQSSEDFELVVSLFKLVLENYFVLVHYVTDVDVVRSASSS